jgi:hypothetical protein
MNTAKQNIALLPEWCWGVLPEDKSLIRIKVGQEGYFPLDRALTEDSKKVFDKKLTTNDIADSLNADMGITKAQRRAMEWGSIFGWGHGASNPERYDENGDFKKELVKQS